MPSKIARSAFALSAGLSLVTLEAARGQYEDAVARFVAQDGLDPLPQGGILFAGSSGIRRFEALTRDFADYHVIQRGIGGAEFDDLIQYADQIVIPYAPRAIVLWAGTNDLVSGSDAAEVVADYQQFVGQVNAELPDTHVYYLGIAPAPGRQGNRTAEQSVNGQIASLAAGDARLHYIDLPATFEALGPYSDPAYTSQFVDPSHFNKAGYDLWTSTIRPVLAADHAPDKGVTAGPDALRSGESLLFDFGPSDGLDGANTASPDRRGNVWNNWFDGKPGNEAILPGEHKANLVNADGRNVGVTMTITGQFLANGFRNGGLRDPDESMLGELAVDSATGDYFFSTGDDLVGGGNDDTNGGFMLSGFDPDLRYDLTFFGSRAASERRVTEYRVFGAGEQAVSLQTSGTGIGSNGGNGNNDEVARLLGVEPDAFGQLFVDLTLLEGSFAHLNTMQITAVPEPTASVAAFGLAAGLLHRRRPQK